MSFILLMFLKATVAFGMIIFLINKANLHFLTRLDTSSTLRTFDHWPPVKFNAFPSRHQLHHLIPNEEPDFNFAVRTREV